MGRIPEIVEKIAAFGLESVAHLKGNLLRHCIGTAEILETWGEREAVVFAGLCHSIYGTDAFPNATVALERRSEIRQALGPEAERLAYLFCAMNRRTLWQNLDRESDFSVFNRWTQQEEKLSEREVSDLFAVALANNIELRPREPLSGKANCKSIYLRARRFLSDSAYQHFLESYNIHRNGMKNVLVIGGRLQTGHRLVYHLLNQGFNVSVLSRGLRRDPFGAEIRRIVADRHNREQFKSALENTTWDFVFDLLCHSPEDAQMACDVFSGRVGRYITLSSQSVYGQPGPMRESAFDPSSYASTSQAIDSTDTMTLPNLLSGGELRRRTEALIAQRMQSPYTFVRIPISLAYHDPTCLLREEIERAIRGEKIELRKIEGSIALIGAYEAVDFLVWLIDHDVQGAVNVASRGALRAREIFATVEEYLGRKLAIETKEEPKHPSRLSISEDWMPDCSLACSMGYSPPEADPWLKPLIKHLAFTAAQKISPSERSA